MSAEAAQAWRGMAQAAASHSAELEAEIERLRTELARRDEQITAVRAIHYEVVVAYERSAGVTHQSECGECGIPWPCPTVDALGAS